jgi:hypothetical protein
MKPILMIMLALSLTGCASIRKPKLLETDNPPGHLCKTHGAIARVYKIGVKYYCKTCVDENIEQVEVMLPKLERK